MNQRINQIHWWFNVHKFMKLSIKFLNKFQGLFVLPHPFHQNISAINVRFWCAIPPPTPWMHMNMVMFLTYSERGNLDMVGKGQGIEMPDHQGCDPD